MAPRDPETDPAAFLGRELKRARQAAGFSSQDALAAHLGFDRSVITKAETGDRPPTDDVLFAWCAATGLDAEHFGRLAVLARRAGSLVPEWFGEWLEAEREAHSLRIWSPLVVPGLLQTAEYARELFLAVGMTEDEAAALADARLERQSILERAEPPLLVAVLDEMVLHRLIGTAEVMAAQLEHVAAVAEKVNVSIHILPATGANAGLSGAFTLATTDSLPETLVLDSVEDRITQDRRLVRRASVLFDLVRRDVLPRVPSHDLILRVAEEWKTKQT
jgi:transcriptional regulator with XRE-family HTH domain